MQDRMSPWCLGRASRVGSTGVHAALAVSRACGVDCRPDDGCRERASGITGLRHPWHMAGRRRGRLGHDQLRYRGLHDRRDHRQRLERRQHVRGGRDDQRGVGVDYARTVQQRQDLQHQRDRHGHRRRPHLRDLQRQLVGERALPARACNRPAPGRQGLREPVAAGNGDERRLRLSPGERLGHVHGVDR